MIKFAFQESKLSMRRVNTGNQSMLTDGSLFCQWQTQRSVSDTRGVRQASVGSSLSHAGPGDARHYTRQHKDGNDKEGVAPNTGRPRQLRAGWRGML